MSSTFNSYGRAAAAMRRVMNVKLPRYTKVIKLANALSDHRLPPDHPKQVLVEVSDLVQNWNWKTFKELVLLDQKYTQAQFIFKSPRGHKVKKVASHFALSRLLNNQLYIGYNDENVIYHPEELRNHPKRQVQIHYSQLATGSIEESGKEVDVPPPCTKISFQSAIGPLEFSIQSLAIFPDTKALGIFETHPDFEKLIGSKVNLPFVGEISFMKVDKDQLGFDEDDLIIPMTPSYVLAHLHYFPDHKRSSFMRFVDPESGKTTTLRSLAKKVASKLLVADPLMTVTPFIAEKYFDKETGEPLTTYIDGQQVLIKYIKPDEVIGAERVRRNFHDDREAFFEVTKSWQKLQDLKAGIAKYNIDQLDYNDFTKLLYEGRRIGSSSRVIKDFKHLDKFSTDMMRSLLLTKTDIADVDVDNEFQIIDLLGCVLQYHWVSNENKFKAGIDVFKPRIADIINFDDILLFKTWDRVVLGKFFSIKTKQDANEFVRHLALHQIIFENEVDISPKRRKMNFELTTNLLVRFLLDHGKKYYPSITQLYLKSMNLEKGYNIDLLPQETANEFNHYIKYPIETFEFDVANSEFYEVIQNILSVPRIGPFLSLNKVILTENPIILDNERLLQKLNPEGTLIFNKIEKDFAKTHCIDKIVRLEETEPVKEETLSSLTSPAAEQQQQESPPLKKTKTTIIFYRDYVKDDAVPETLFKKLDYLRFKVTKDISIEQLKRDLLVRLLTDMNKVCRDREAGNINHPITRNERSRLYTFVSKFVANLPEEFYRHPLIKKVSLEEFMRDDQRSKYAQVSNEAASAIQQSQQIEQRLEGIIIDFLQKNTQK